MILGKVCLMVIVGLHILARAPAANLSRMEKVEQKTRSAFIGFSESNNLARKADAGSRSTDCAKCETHAFLARIIAEFLTFKAAPELPMRSNGDSDFTPKGLVRCTPRSRSGRHAGPQDPEKTWRKIEGLRRQAMGGNHKKKKHIQGACLKGQIPRPNLKSYL